MRIALFYFISCILLANIIAYLLFATACIIIVIINQLFQTFGRIATTFL